MEFSITSEVAEVVGLWLAEGDNKTGSEITFTNNSLELIKFFGSTIQRIFKDYDLNPRIYVYSAGKENTILSLDYPVKYYTDKRAKKPYFIFRVASIEVVKQWGYIVEKVKIDKGYYADILRGFFAGEGNIKKGSHSCRAIRIAQKKPNKLIEEILDYHGISYKFFPRERTYQITGKWNWEKLARIRMADLHPEKRGRFWDVFNEFKEEHYPDYRLKNEILKLLDEPWTSLELAKRFNRSQARVQDILIPLKKRGIVRTFRVRSKNYWISADQNVVIISDVKEKYFKLLKRGDRTTKELAKEFDVCWKSAHRRLMELQKLDIVTKNSNGLWNVIPIKKEVIVL